MIPFKIKIFEKPHISLTPRPKIFKLQEDVWKFNEMTASGTVITALLNDS